MMDIFKRLFLKQNCKAFSFFSLREHYKNGGEFMYLLQEVSSFNALSLCFNLFVALLVYTDPSRRLGAVKSQSWGAFFYLDIWRRNGGSFLCMLVRLFIRAIESSLLERNRRKKIGYNNNTCSQIYIYIYISNGLNAM